MNVNNVFDLMAIVNMEDGALLELMQNVHLLKKRFRCTVRRCRRICTVQSRSNVPLGHVFYCRSCKKRYSIV